MVIPEVKKSINVFQMGVMKYTHFLPCSTQVGHVKVKSLNKKLLIDNNITVPTDINSLSTKSAKSYNKSWQTLPQCQKVLNLTTNIDKTCHNVIYPRKLPNLTKKSAKSYNKSAKSYNKSAKSYNKYWPSLPQ